MYAIAGVTGHTGRATAEALLQAGEKVRVIVREAGKGAPWRERGAEVAVADLGDEAALTRALQGAKGAYLLLPPDPGAPDVLASRRAMTEVQRRALRAAGVKNVVFLSSVAAHLAEGTGPIRIVHAAEKLLAEEPGITFLRPDYFMENWASNLGPARDGQLPSWNPPGRKITMVATRDIGALAAELLRQGPDGRPRVVELTGPEAVSDTDVAAIVGDLLGREVQVANVPAQAVPGILQQFGVGASLAGLYGEFAQALHDGRIVFEGTPRRGKTPVREVLRGLLG